MSRARLGATLVLAAALSVSMAACANNSGGSTTTSAAAPSSAASVAVPTNAADPKGDGKGQCSNASLAYIGTINGSNAALGIAILNAAKLAVQQHNAANPNCNVTLKQFDSEGTPDKAPGVVTQAINDPTILGVIGLPFSGESKAVGKTFNDAGLVTVTPSATNPNLTKNGWKTFFRGLGNDAVQGPAAAKFITGALNSQKVCVVADDSEYGTGLAGTIKAALGPKLACEDSVKTNQKDFAATVQKIQAANPDAVFYSGYYTEAAPLAQQVRDAGITAKFIAPDGVKDDQFVKNAGDASDGAYFTCPCTDGSKIPGFGDAYTQQYGTPPATYSAESYDVTTILLKGLDKGLKDRASMLDYVKNYDGQGLTKHYKWGPDGELSDTPVFAYKVTGGKIVLDQPIN